MSTLGPLHNLDTALERIQDKMVHTDKGSYVKVDDLKEAMAEGREAAIREAVKPQPRTMAQARRMIRQDEELMEHFKYDRMAPPGKSVPAMETQPPSRA